MVTVKQKLLKRKLILPISLAVLLFLFIGSVILYFYLPKYVESKILPKLSQKAGINILGCDVRRIGFVGLDLGGLYIGDSNETSISIESVRVDYSIKGLLRRHIDSVVIAGIEFNCEFSNGEFIIPGVDLQSFFAESPPHQSSPPREEDKGEGDYKVPEDDLQIPIGIGSLRIRNAVFVCNYNGQSHRIPFDLLAVAKEGHRDIFECTLSLYPRGQKLTLSSSIDLPAEKALFKLHFDSFHLDRFEDIVSLLPGLKISGDVEAACNLTFSQRAIESSGRFFVTLEQSNRNQYSALQILEPLNTAVEFSAKFAQTGEWEFKLSNDSPSKESAALVKDCKLRFNMMDIISKFPNVAISGEGMESKGKVKYTTKLYGFNLVQENATVKVPSISLTGDANLDSNFMEGTVDFENGEISDDEHNTKITGFGGKIPFQWPCEDLGEGGNFLVEAIDWDNLKLGTISGTIRQSGLGVVFEGNHNNSLLPGLTLNFKGNGGYFAEEDFKTELNFSVLRFNSNLVNLGEFIPEAEGILFSGELELDGNLFLDAEGNIKCSMNTVVQNSSLKLEKQGIAIEGISFALSMPDVLSMRSAPNQQFHFKKASFGEITFSDGKIGLQIESPEIIFVENCEFKWCNGTVYTHALRVPLYETDYDITLYCDRLELSKILGQFGIAKAEGSGAVNGRIPIEFAKGKLFIDNGFLYSTPGKGGIIHIAGTDVFDIGIPKDTPQYSQLDFTKEALKDFSYNWVTLLLNTEEDDLIVQMSFNGKPMEPLPFTYDRKLGTFVRIQAGSELGITQPIHLDINFHVPINKILHYGQSVKGVIDILK